MSDAPAAGAGRASPPAGDPAPAGSGPAAPHSPRVALGLFLGSATLAFLVTRLPRGAEGSWVRSLAPTLGFLAWTAPTYLVLERAGRSPGGARDPLGVLGLTERPRDLARASLTLLLLPLYAVGFWVLLRGGATPRLPDPGGVAWALVWHLGFAALPEEVFFRGSLQPSLAALAPGKPLRAVVLTAALFALAHVAIDPSGLGPGARALVFFPSLVFGWLRERTGSVWPSVVFHALCNGLEHALASA